MPQYWCRAPTPLPVTISALCLHPFPRLLNQPLRLSNIAHSSTQLALFALLDLLHFASCFDVLLGSCDKALEAAFEILSNVLALVEHTVTVTDGLDIFDSAGEVERGPAIGELVFALGDDALDFFLIGCFVDVHVDIGRRFRHNACLFRFGDAIFACADVEEKRIF